MWQKAAKNSEEGDFFPSRLDRMGV